METVEAIAQEIAALNGQFEADVAALEAKVDPATEVMDRVVIRPKKTSISVQLVALGWKAS